MKFDAVLFDCDGVLVDSEVITNQVIADTLNAYGATVTLEQVIPLFLGRSLQESHSVIADLIKQAVPKSFFADFLIARDKALAQQVQAVPHIASVIAALQDRHRLFAVASGADLQKMHVTLSKTGLLPAFAGRMFGKDHVPRSKPAPDVYLFAAHALQVAPNRCVVIEDTPTGVIAGVCAGAKVIAYAGAPHSDANALLAAGAWAVINNMATLHEILF